MQCVCGYVYEISFAGVEVGDEPFVRILEAFKADEWAEDGGFVKVDLHICPKCQTVRAER